MTLLAARRPHLVLVEDSPDDRHVVQRWLRRNADDCLLETWPTGEAFLRADAFARSKVFGDATDSSYTVIPGYALVNSSIGFRAAKGWEIAVFVRNLFDRNYLQNVTVQAGNSGLIVGTPSDPRMFGITFRVQGY